jgi:Tfp pilus assembly protein PilW
MFHSCNNRENALTMLELLIAMTVLAMVVGTLGGLAATAQQGFQFSQGYGLATQHARVVLDRITRSIYAATANEQFPGCIVLADNVNGFRYPDTLVVWRPNGTPAAPTGLPLYSELVIYCPKWNNPNQLVEITAPTDFRTVPPVTDTASWQSEITAIKSSSQSTVVNLSNLLRTCPISSTSGAPLRGAVRFETRLRPSQTDWDNYKANPTAANWTNLPWVQGLYGWQAGMRQVWVRMELQLTPQVAGSYTSEANKEPACFFGTASIYYQLLHQ